MSPTTSPKGGPGEELIRWSRGELRIRVHDDVVFEHVTGYFEKEIVAKYTAPIDRLIASGVRPTLFIDASEMTGYDSDTRLKLTDWTFWIRDKISGCHILVRSKIVSMGVSIANLALGGLLKVSTDRGEFSLAYSRALRPPGRITSPASERGVERTEPRSEGRLSERGADMHNDTQRPPRSVR